MKTLLDKQSENNSSWLLRSGKVERRKGPRESTARANWSSMTSSLWTLELLPSVALQRLSTSIFELSERSVDSNLFFEPEVLLAAWPRLTSWLAPGGCKMLCLWETVNDSQHLRFFMPVGFDRPAFSIHEVLRPVSNPFMPLGTPLVDSSCAEETVETLLRLLGDKSLGVPMVLDLTHQIEDSETFRIIVEAARSLGLSGRITQSHKRAALLPTNGSDTDCGPRITKKSERELARQSRRLEEKAPLRFDTARTTHEVLDAFEHFMSIELSGWKGRRSSALYNHKRIAAFSRQIVSELAISQACEIVTLRHGHEGEEKAIASVILLGKGGNLMPWKMTFDEDYASSSPGMLMMTQLTKQLLKRKDFVFADSLADKDHWMMNRLWRHRIGVVDYTIAITPEADSKIKKIARAKELRAYLRDKAKKVLAKFGALKRALRR